MIEAWASHKSFRRNDGANDDPTAGGDFHGEKRTNQTHASTTDPDARLCKKSKGKEAPLSYLGHIVTENRHVSVLRELNVTPHVIQNDMNRRSAIDRRTTRQVGYESISLGKRWLVGKAFGWFKQTGPLRK